VEVQEQKVTGYHPRSYYASNPNLRQALDQLRTGHFSPGDRELFMPLVNNLLDYDPFMLLADYQSYIDCQDRVSAAYRDQEQWVRMSILNVARMGKFSSDRSIREYCDNIWKINHVSECEWMMERETFFSGQPVIDRKRGSKFSPSEQPCRRTASISASFSKNADAIELLLFDNAEDLGPHAHNPS